MPEFRPRLRARLDRTQIDAHRDTTAFLVVEVTAPDVEQDTRPAKPLNLSLVVDASYSMAGNTLDGYESDHESSRLAAAQRAASGVVERLDDADVLSVVSFADETLTHIAAMPMSGGGRADATDAIHDVRTRGCTDLNAGWLKGAEHVARYMETHAETRNRVLLLSDGYANQGIVEPELLANTATGLRQRGVFTSTVGIGTDYSTDQLEVLSEHGGGMMHHADHAEDIVAVILAELNDMRTALLDDIEVVVSQDFDSDTDDAGSPVVSISAVGYGGIDGDGIVRTSIGSLVSGASRRVVLRLDLPPVGRRTEATFNVSVTWRGEGDSSASQQVTLTIDPDHSIPRDREVALLAAQAWLDETVRRSMVMNRGENFHEMRGWAKVQMSSFQRYCRRLPGGDDLIRRMQRLLHRVQRPMQEYNRKEISLSRQKSLRSSADYRVASPVKDWSSYLDEE